MDQQSVARSHLPDHVGSEKCDLRRRHVLASVGPVDPEVAGDVFVAGQVSAVTEFPR